MGLSKRQKERREEDKRQWDEYIRENPPPPPPPWTDVELAELDKMRAALDKVIYAQGHEIDSVSEILRFSYLFAYSQRMAALRILVPHYLRLKQLAAKEKVWLKIYSAVNGLPSELHLLRISRDRGGANVQ